MKVYFWNNFDEFHIYPNQQILSAWLAIGL